MALFLGIFRRRQRHKKVLEDIQLSKCSYHKEEFSSGESTLCPTEFAVSLPSATSDCLQLQSVKLDCATIAAGKTKKSCLLRKNDRLSSDPCSINSICEAVLTDPTMVPMRSTAGPVGFFIGIPIKYYTILFIYNLKCIFDARTTVNSFDLI